MSVLSDISNDLARVVETAGASIVRVEARKRLPATGIVWSADGYIMTAHHVVRQDKDIKIGLPNGDSTTATLVGRDHTTDLAILKADVSNLTPLIEANKNDIKVGHFVLALGRPYHTVQATLGILSAVGHEWRTRQGGIVDKYLQTDVVMYPGFSGGPLVNAQGHLVGLNSSALMQGVSLTLPTSTLSKVADSLLTHGHIKRGYLGVNTQRAKLPKVLQEALGQRTGLLVVAVEADSPADQSGLTMGDTLVKLADQTVQSHEALLALLTGDYVGQTIPAKIVRAGRVESLDLHVGERPL